MWYVNQRTGARQYSVPGSRHHARLERMKEWQPEAPTQAPQPLAAPSESLPRAVELSHREAPVQGDTHAADAGDAESAAESSEALPSDRALALELGLHRWMVQVFGLGEAQALTLWEAGYQDASALMAASRDDVLDLPGIGEGTWHKIAGWQQKYSAAEAFVDSMSTEANEARPADTAS